MLVLTLFVIGFQPTALAATPTNACEPLNRNGQRVNLGLPRSTLFVPSTGKVPILVAVVDFTNARANESPDSEVRGFELQKVKDFYQQSSYGKLNFEFTIVNEILHLSYPDININSLSNLAISQYASQALPPTYDLDNFKGLLIVTTKNSSYSRSSASAETKVENSSGKLFSLAVLAGIKPNENRWHSSPWLTVIHELGHMMGLMDLWNRENSTAWQGKTSGPFSIMNTGAGWNYAPDFFAWEKYILGWLDESEVICLSQNTDSLKGSISPVSSSTGVKLVIIPDFQTQYTAFEFRQRSPIDFGLVKSGILAYKIDFTKGNFEVPITLLLSPEALSTPLASNFQDWQRNKSAPINRSEIVDTGTYRIANLGILTSDNFWVSSLSVTEVGAALLELQTAADKAAADKAAAELKAKQEAEAKASAELKAKQDAEAKAATATLAARKKTTITCTKGKLTKKVTAIKPKCPAGYKKKK
jgi:M6 family metalloprotease-like protein